MFQHWIRLELQRNILIEQLAVQVEQSDSSYMPSVVAVMAGNTVGGLRELKQLSVPSTCRECILVSGLTEVYIYTTLQTVILYIPDVVIYKLDNVSNSASCYVFSLS